MDMGWASVTLLHLQVEQGELLSVLSWKGRAGGAADGPSCRHSLGCGDSKQRHLHPAMLFFLHVYVAMHYICVHIHIYVFKWNICMKDNHININD